MSHLDYCSANYLHVVGHKTGNDFFVVHLHCNSGKRFWGAGRACAMSRLHPQGSCQDPHWKVSLSFFPLEKNRRTRRRRERDLASPVESPERRKLLQRVALLEEESFATLIATLPHFADNLSSNSGSWNTIPPFCLSIRQSKLWHHSTRSNKQILAKPQEVYLNG